MMFRKVVPAMKRNPADAIMRRTKLEQSYRALLAGFILRDIDHDCAQKKIVKSKKGIRCKAVE